MVSFLSILLFGFLLGMRHATDADHVVAVATLVGRERTLRAAAPLGAIWGLGHTVTILLVGGAIILFDIVIPPRVGLLMELAVAVMLLLLGGLSLSVSLRRKRGGERPEAHAHAGDAPHDHGPDHDHPHHHEGGDLALARLDRRLGRFGAYRFVRPLVVGLVHGLAGSAAVALLVLGTIRDPLWALGYLAVFGVGTIAGMLLITTALAMSFVYTARRFERLHRGLDVAAGLLSVGFGAFLVYEIGFVHGLFTSHPEWIPS
jgi:ABC-type nickel/cobalt efflux system permease component RcnA